MSPLSRDVSSSVRVRFAPSPTGYLHVGGLRTLLFNWLYAQKTHGTLVLRIEDTDQARSTRANEEMLLQDVERCSLTPQEGPVQGGPHVPYRQSERREQYATHATKLLSEGRAFYCFCSDEVIGQKREVALKLGRPPVYDGTCARLSAAEVQQKLSRGEKAGVRFKAPAKSFVLQDAVRGRVEFKEGTVGDFLITRTPGAGEQEIATGIGMPVYNFCCVIDDHLRGMTHVIRGEDHLSNTARQLMLYDAFGWELPMFAHIAMVLGTDRQKLSKRNGDVSVHEYLDKGYLPEALLNFLALLGWWPPNDFKPKSGHPEILSVQEMAETFSLEGLQKSPAVFDVQKLQWMNGFYLRMMPLADVLERARPFLAAADASKRELIQAWTKDRGDEALMAAVDIVRAETALLSEIPAALARLLEVAPQMEDEAKVWAASPDGQRVLEALEASLKQMSQMNLPMDTSEAVDTWQKTLIGASGVKGKPFFMSLRSWLTGRTHGPELRRVLPLLGSDRLAARVQGLKAQMASHVVGA